MEKKSKLSVQSSNAYKNQLKNILAWKTGVKKNSIDLEKISEKDFEDINQIYNLIKSHTDSLD